MILQFKQDMSPTFSWNFNIKFLINPNTCQQNYIDYTDMDLNNCDL